LQTATRSSHSIIDHQSSIINSVEAIMPLVKLTCPHCRATLKPAKPVPEGKTVKCPKCNETFKAGEDGAAPEAAAEPAKAEAPATSAPGAKAYDEAEEESGGTYAVAEDEADGKKAEEGRKKKKKKKWKGAADEDDDEDEDDPTAQYLKNLKPRDPRGKAQEVVVSPANWLLRTALLGFFGWVFYFIVFMIPIAFPNREPSGSGDTAKGQSSGGDKKGKPKLTDDDLKDLRADGVSDAGMRKIEAIRGKEFESVEQMTNAALKGLDKDDAAIVKKNKKFTSGKKDKYQHWWSAETILDEDTRAWSVPLFIFVLLLGVAQAGVIAIGSVKMQGLEDYNWSMIGCITAMIPLTTFPLFVFLTGAFDLFDSALEAGWVDITWMFGLIAFIWGPLVGGLCLKQLMQPEVKPGFEYRPE
jgi:predicted Zn finger-like uncharacterized protein